MTIERRVASNRGLAFCALFGACLVLLDSRSAIAQRAPWAEPRGDDQLPLAPRAAEASSAPAVVSAPVELRFRSQARRTTIYTVVDAWNQPVGRCAAPCALRVAPGTYTLYLDTGERAWMSGSVRATSGTVTVDYLRRGNPLLAIVLVSGGSGLALIGIATLLAALWASSMHPSIPTGNLTTVGGLLTFTGIGIDIFGFVEAAASSHWDLLTHEIARRGIAHATVAPLCGGAMLGIDVRF